MRHFALAFLMVLAVNGLAYGQQCAAPRAPSCNAPCYTPRGPESPPLQPESAPRQPEGAYIRGPESGEFEGGSSSFGLKGFGFKLPSLSFEGPELRLPNLTRYRRNPAFHSESARAPFVRGPVTEFNQVPRQESARQPESVRQPETAPTFDYHCVPPAPPCTGATERRLLKELAQRDAEIEEMQDRLRQFEETVNRLIESQQQSREVTANTKRPAQPKVQATGYSDEKFENKEAPAKTPPSQAVPSDATRVRQFDASQASRASTPTKPSTLVAPKQKGPVQLRFPRIIAESNIGK